MPWDSFSTSHLPYFYFPSNHSEKWLLTRSKYILIVLSQHRERERGVLGSYYIIITKRIPKIKIKDFLHLFWCTKAYTIKAHWRCSIRNCVTFTQIIFSMYGNVINLIFRYSTFVYVWIEFYDLPLFIIFNF